MKYHFSSCGVLLLLSFLLACGETPNPDLTTLIVGEYTGTVALNLDTDSLKDVPNQRIRISKIDDETVSIEALEYPDSSPVDTLLLTALLTRTPYGFIQTEGVMLTIEMSSFSEGSVKGTPYLVSGGGDRSEDGKFENNTGEILFTLQILKNGVDYYELFEGIKQ